MKQASILIQNKSTQQQTPHLNSGADKKVLLLQAQLLALVRAVIWVQHTAQGLCTLLAQDGRHVVT